MSGASYRRRIWLVRAGIGASVAFALLAIPLFRFDDESHLQGTWQTTSLVADGKTLVDPRAQSDERSTARLTYEGNDWSIQAEGKTVARGKFRLDARKRPKQIDVMDESGQINAKTQFGIYELDGDTYRYCVAPPGQTRPIEFSSREGTKHALVVSRRVTP